MSKIKEWRRSKRAYQEGSPYRHPKTGRFLKEPYNEYGLAGREVEVTYKGKPVTLGSDLKEPPLPKTPRGSKQ
jgi:hypothetical protein